MTKRIFKAVCIASLSVFLVTMLLVLGVLYNYFSSVQRNQLKAETYLASQGVSQSGSSFFEGLNTDQYRITWIATDGTVLYDSSSDSLSMENHLEREEIREALETGHGESTRYSSTLTERSLYCAHRLNDGSVIRLSVSHESVILLLIGMIQPILIIIVVAATLSFILANRLSKRIVEPLNRLNLDNPMENKDYDELSPLLLRLSNQQIQLKQQEAVLQQKQNELNTIIGNMQEGMVLLDKSCKVISINNSAKRLLDAGHAHSGDSLLTVSRNPELNNAVEKAMAGQNTDVRTTLHRKIIQISAAPISSGDEISGTAIVFFDITQQEKAEQQRREFTANVSHELKTPLHTISGYSELIKCGLAAPEDVKPFAGKIYGETQRLISLVEDIISLSHLDEGGKDLTFTNVDLYQSANLVVESLKTLASTNGIQISLTGESSVISGVPELVRGIIYNLCDNAIKYNRAGGSVTVNVHDSSLTVKDTGIGIPEEHLDRIFERFYRVDKSHSKEVGGTGLGLSIVKHAALIHKAEITVDSKVGEGTSITVKFPA